MKKNKELDIVYKQLSDGSLMGWVKDNPSIMTTGKKLEDLRINIHKAMCAMQEYKISQN